MSDAVSLDEIRAAQGRIGDAIYHSPCPRSLALSRLCGCDVYCKLDHLQMTGSFKERGARNRLLRLTADEKRRGVIAASAGNHALGLAYHGQLLGIPVTVVMPKAAPIVKVTNTRGFGATVVQHGDTYADALRLAMDKAESDGLQFISGFDHPDIINGQGTMGLEILADVPAADVIVVPIGGGGLIAGVSVAVKSLRPQVRVIGVEPVNAPTMYDSLRNGKPTRIAARPTLADGLAVGEPGHLCFDIVRRLVDEVVLVDEPQIARAVVQLLEMEKTVVEGSAAVPLAAVTGQLRDQLAGKTVVLCLCGGNIDTAVIGRVIERGLAAEGRLCRISAFISDRPGGLARLLALIAEAGASIKEVVHDRHFGPADVWDVAVSCVVETRDADHVRSLRQSLGDAGVHLRDEA